MKILRTAVISMLFSVVTGLEDFTEPIHDERWTCAKTQDFDNYTWSKQIFTVRDACPVEFGEMGTSKHLRISCRPKGILMDIYNGSTRNQFYGL
jgi:hypothetical protein